MNDKGFSGKFVSQKFDEFYIKKWLGLGKTTAEFVEAIHDIIPNAKCDYKYVSKWRRGYMSPVKYLPAICQILDVDISEFTPKTHEEKYHYSAKYADGLEGSLEKIAEQNFKIDLTFFQGLRNIIPEFDKTFPVFSPLHFYDVTDHRHKPYQRSVPAESKETSLGQGLFQITRNEKTYFLTKNDMKFIRGIQGAVRKYVTSLFEAHQKKLENDEAQANVIFWEKTMEFNPDYSKDETLWITYELSDEELQQIDPSGIYTESEEKRFKLPPKGTLLYQDHTETED